MHNLVGSVVYAVIKGLTLLMPWSSYIDCYMMVLVLRRVFGPKRDEITRDGESYIMRSLVICTPYPILCGW